eukprot:CAMPEP_0119334622 /NCGR_PEP_ID=MMETSP1333-20130426/87680_1 /TAXON_ID=418940 /ORGANISM="Scyphosphaera apsteinii, Strain RCC1455" /LENGTH=470 /DNA_ID=CAMNT_0007344961 /DNA_START=145 /DNA_END=1558 /DNA_ORIENTATION=+
MWSDHVPKGRDPPTASARDHLQLLLQRTAGDDPATRDELTLLESFVSHENDSGYVLKESLASPKALEDACAKFPLHEWLKNCQPLKRDKRCPMHTNSRHIFNSADLWEDMWAEMSSSQKTCICTVNAEELHDKLWQHCTDKHHLCKDCRNNVMWAFDKLTKKEQPPVGTEAEQEAELASLQAYFDVEKSKEGSISVHASALPTILYHYEDTLAEESESSAKGRHAPTRQAGLSEMLCVVGRLLLRKVLTSYQSSLEEEQNQQLLVRLVLSYFQAQTLERMAQQNMESLLEEDSTPAKSGASKRKLKKDRRLKRQEATDEPGVTWDEEHELTLLTQMGWNKCVGMGVSNRSTCCGGSGSSTQLISAPAVDDSPSPECASVSPSAAAQELPDAAQLLHLEPLEPLDPNVHQLQLTEKEWLEWEEHKGELLEERQRMRAHLKQQFEDFCERYAPPAAALPRKGLSSCLPCSNV